MRCPVFLKNNKWPVFLFWLLLSAIFIFYARLKWTELVVYSNGCHYEI